VLADPGGEGSVVVTRCALLMWNVRSAAYSNQEGIDTRVNPGELFGQDFLQREMP
jgi:hypothetical protein